MDYFSIVRSDEDEKIAAKIFERSEAVFLALRVLLFCVLLSFYPLAVSALFFKISEYFLSIL